MRERRLSLDCVAHTNSGRVFQIIVGLCCTRERVWAWRQTKRYIQIFDAGKSKRQREGYDQWLSSAGRRAALLDDCVSGRETGGCMALLARSQCMICAAQASQRPG